MIHTGTRSTGSERHARRKSDFRFNGWRVSGMVDTAEGAPIPIPNAETFDMASRIAIAPTFGLGFTFYVNRWSALGFEWRAVPFSRNTGEGEAPGVILPRLQFDDLLFQHAKSTAGITTREGSAAKSRSCVQ